MAQQGPPPPRSGRMPASRSRRPWQDEDYNAEEEYPPWAGPGIIPRYADHDERERRRLGDRAGSARAPRETYRADPGVGRADPGGERDRSRMPRPGRSAARIAANRTQRTRRAIWGGALAVVVIIISAVAAFVLTSRTPAPTTTGGLVTTFQPGEFKTVPKACSAVSTAILDQYLPGHRRIVRPHSLFGAAQSLCDWSVDSRWLNVTVQAYAPSGLASGDGSATDAAIAAYKQALAKVAHPLKSTHLPKATVATVPGLGQVAFAGLQAPSAGGATTDIMTVVTRQRNVLVTVVYEVSAKGRAVPVSSSQLRSGAVAAARGILAHLH